MSDDNGIKTGEHLNPIEKREVSFPEAMGFETEQEIDEAQTVVYEMIKTSMSHANILNAIIKNTAQTLSQRAYLCYWLAIVELMAEQQKFEDRAKLQEQILSASAPKILKIQ